MFQSLHLPPRRIGKHGLSHILLHKIPMHADEPLMKAMSRSTLALGSAGLGASFDITSGLE